MVLAARREVTLGRDALCDVVLRSGGISRTHAAIAVEGDGASRTFVLRDLGSRNGTRIGDLPIAGAVPLAGAGAFSLGDDCTLEFEVRGDPPLLAVEVVSGIDRGVALVAGADGDELPVPSVPAVVQFSGGSPRLRTVPSGTPLRLNDRAVALGSVELIHRDALSIAGIELEVL
ncbi:MAG: FHA domain-containing protein [Deltaproteobacteria bacterium]|nr:MAG: FHA domain-containing protein [Deltaproteobacteria bacterium]